MKQRYGLLNILVPAILIITGTGCGQADNIKMPSHLSGYEELYAENPRQAALQWFADAKYGLFMHFGLYSLEGYGARYQMGRSLKPYWDFDPIPVREYEKLMYRWEIKEFDADFIADLALNAGMRYITITAKHCDGFCLWDSKSDYFNSVNSAAGTDVIGELARACRERGLGFFPFYEIGYDTRHAHAHPQGRVDYEKWTGKKDPAYAYGDTLDVSKYVDAVHEHVRELLEYDISGIWFDGYGVTRDKADLFRLQELYDMVHDAAPWLILSNKLGPTGTEDFISPEGHLQPPAGGDYSRLAARGKKIEVCKSMAGGWGWHSREHFLPGERYAWTPDQLWEQLKMYNTLDANLLLNIGPRWDGGIEQEQVDVLLEVGERIRKEGYPLATGEEREMILQKSQEIIDRKILSMVQSVKLGQLRKERLRLAMNPGSAEYRQVAAEMRRLMDVNSNENREILDNWYEEHRADWFERYRKSVP